MKLSDEEKEKLEEFLEDHKEDIDQKNSDFRKEISMGKQSDR